MPESPHNRSASSAANTVTGTGASATPDASKKTGEKPARRKPMANRSLRRKQAARLLAIRALYSSHFNEELAEMTIDALADHLLAYHQQAHHEDDAETAFTEAPERAMLLTLLESTRLHEPAVNELIVGSMGEKWSSERMGPLLGAILRVAIAEMMAKKDRNVGIIISEYVTLTEAYFDDNEVGFVNAILSTIAKKLRD